MAFVDQIDQLYDLSHRVIKDLNYISRRVDGLRHKIRTIKVLLTSLAKELTNLEKKLNDLRNSHATIEQELEQLFT